MATQCSTNFTEFINQQPSVTSQPEQHTSQPDYDFVDQPDQDYFCPVSLELLTQPHQTTCCGNHISQQAADRLIREGKSCPLCKKDNFVTHKDLYFTRKKVRQLKVYCSYKKNGCEWTGELGDLNQHTTSCPKHPWKFPHCPFQNIGTTDHTPQCDYQLVPCPNHCQVGTVPRCQVEKHLLTCPLQLVDCEFASVGCDVRVPRKDLAGHMTESAQHHLMTATLLNLQLTKDLHQKMEEKDKQIVQLQTQLQQLNTKVDTKLRKVNTAFQQLKNWTSKVKTIVKANKGTLYNDLLLLQGFICHEIILTEFTQYQAKEGDGEWMSAPFSNTPNETHLFNLSVYTNDWDSTAQKKIISVGLDKTHNNKKTEGVAVLQLLNQLADQKHFTGAEKQFSKHDNYVWLDDNCFPLADLGYNAANNTQYLKDNCLKFRLFLKVIVS